MSSARRKLTADDIGLPENFRHVLQLAWSEDGELKLRNSVEPELQNLFRMEGVTDGHTQNDKIKDFLINFIRKTGGMEAIRKKISRPAPPPPDPPMQSCSKPEKIELPQKDTLKRLRPPGETPKSMNTVMQPKGPAPPPPGEPTLRKLPVPAPRSKITKSSSDEQQIYENSLVGLDEQPTYAIPTNVNPDPPTTLEKGQVTAELDDNEILEALCDFLSKFGGIEAIKKEIEATPSSEFTSSSETRPASISHFPRTPGNTNRNPRASYIPPPKVNDNMNK